MDGQRHYTAEAVHRHIVSVTTRLEEIRSCARAAWSDRRLIEYGEFLREEAWVADALQRYLHDHGPR